MVYPVDEDQLKILKKNNRELNEENEFKKGRTLNSKYVVLQLVKNHYLTLWIVT